MDEITWIVGVGLGFLYLFSIGILIRRQEVEALIQGLLISSFAGGSIALSLFLTEGWDVTMVPLNLPWLGLIAFMALEFLYFWITHRGYFPKLMVYNLEIGEAVIMKLFFLCFIPLILMFAKGDSLRGMGLEFSYWQRELEVGLVVGVPWLLLGLFGLLISKRLFKGKGVFMGKGGGLRGASSAKIAPALAIAFGYHIFQTAIPEEFFYRTFLQGHLTSLLPETVAIILSSLVFGLVHIAFYYTISKSEIAFLSALARAVLVQVSLGLLLGVLWARTGSLIPIVLLHALMNTPLTLEHVLKNVLRGSNSYES